MTYYVLSGTLNSTNSTTGMGNYCTDCLSLYRLYQLTVLCGCTCQVLKVREMVKSASNDQIVLVLQYYENDVDRTINAFLEGCT